MNSQSESEYLWLRPFNVAQERSRRAGCSGVFFVPLACQWSLLRRNISLHRVQSLCQEGSHRLNHMQYTTFPHLQILVVLRNLSVNYSHQETGHKSHLPMTKRDREKRETRMCWAWHYAACAASSALQQGHCTARGAILQSRRIPGKGV